MLSRYADVLRRPGAFPMSAAGFVARLPMSMLGLGTVLLVVSRHGSYALAGALSAASALAGAGLGPVIARWVDRLGQHVVLPLLVAVHVVSLLSFIALVVTGASTPLLFLSVVVAGGTFPPIGALVRARWSYVLADEPGAMRTAYAYESVLDEAIFVLGPPFATILAVSVADYSALLAGLVILVAGTIMLLRSRHTEPPPGGTHARGQGTALRFPGVLAVTVAFVFLGGLFGAFEVVTVAFAAEQDVRPATGLLLGVYALGSGIAGVVVGAAHLSAPLPRQLLAYTLFLTVVTLPFPFIDQPLQLGVALLLAGLAVSPVLISGFALIERIVPAERLTEGLVWAGAGIAVGVALAAALAGQVIDRSGASTAYWICTVSALLTFLIVLVSTPSLARAWAAAMDDDEGLVHGS